MKGVLQWKNIQEEYGYIAENFNAMPLEYRKTSIDSELLVRIQDLLRLKDRVKENYEREVNYINDRIKGYERGLKENKSLTSTTPSLSTTVTNTY